MKLKTALLFLLISILGFSQEYRMIYDFKWKSDKADKTYNSELMALANDGKNSYFESLVKFKYDSLTTDLRNKGSHSFPFPEEEWKFPSLIIKDFKNQTTTAEQEIFDKIYSTKYSCKPRWNILKEKDKIFDYKVQKAETDFGGRKWYAWFTTEIPINDGPYKFYGLPGLILKINDSEEYFIFEIKGLTKEKSDISRRNSSALVNLTPKQWNSFWEKYKKEPANIFQNLNETGATYSYQYNGMDVTTKEAQIAYNKAEMKKINIFKNPIELKSCE